MGRYYIPALVALYAFALGVLVGAPAQVVLVAIWASVTIPLVILAKKPRTELVASAVFAILCLITLLALKD